MLHFSRSPADEREEKNRRTEEIKREKRGRRGAAEEVVLTEG